MSTHNQSVGQEAWRDSKRSPAAAEKNQLVLKAFAVLSCFQRSDEWVTGGELSRRANLPQASGYRLIQTLEKIGAIIRGPRGRYRPGMLLVSLSQNVAIGELLRNFNVQIENVTHGRSAQSVCRLPRPEATVRKRPSAPLGR